MEIADISTIILRAYITGDQLHQVKLDEKSKNVFSRMMKEKGGC